jgi:hypothetical protein
MSNLDLSQTITITKDEIQGNTKIIVDCLEDDKKNIELATQLIQGKGGSTSVNLRKTVNKCGNSAW